MHPNDLLAPLHRKPFEPFRIVTTDGTTYEVRHPELVVVSTRSAVIGYPDPNIPGAASRYDVVSLLHMIRLEEAESPAAPA
jgi:hypothetical protein